MRDKVVKSISSRAEAVVKPWSHSSSLEPSNFKNVSEVDKLVVKLLQEHQSFLDRVKAEKAEGALQQQKKKDMSNFLVPPPPPGLRTQNALSSLLSSTAVSSIVSPHPTATKMVHNNQQVTFGEYFNINKAEEKEKSSAIRVAKRKKQPVLAGVDAGALLYSSMGQKDPTVVMFSLLLVELQRLEVAAEEHHEKNKAAAQLCLWKAEAAAEQLRKEEADRKLCFMMGRSQRRSTR